MIVFSFLKLRYCMNISPLFECGDSWYMTMGQQAQVLRAHKLLQEDQNLIRQSHLRNTWAGMPIWILQSVNKVSINPMLKRFQIQMADRHMVKFQRAYLSTTRRRVSSICPQLLQPSKARFCVNISKRNKDSLRSIRKLQLN